MIPPQEVTSLESLAWTASYYTSIALSIILPALTAYWAWRAYRNSRKIGYLLLLVLALSPYFVLTLSKVGNYIHRERIEEMQRERMAQAPAELHGQGIVVFERRIDFPLYPILLAAGIFLLYRSEKKRDCRPPRTTIYMHLENEGVDVWRPVEAIKMNGGIFQIITESQEGESGQFPSGSRVICETKKVEGKEILVAVRLVPYKTEIILKEDGFTLRSTKKEDFVLFSDVSAIRAYKVDLLAYDEICILFEKGKGEPVEVSEEALGFHDLMKHVTSRFTGSDAHWFEKVAHPAFALCPTIIWKQEPASQPETAPTQE